MIQIKRRLADRSGAPYPTLRPCGTTGMTVRELAHRQAAPTTVIGSPCNSCEIREISVCSALDAAEIERLRAIIATVHYEPGQTIIGEGDPAESLFNVVSGTVRLHKLLPDGRRQITGFLLPGDFLGIALNESYAYTAEAVD